MAEAFAPAKINLSLHITGRREDGYHLLDSLVVFADVGDTVSLGPDDDWSLHVTGPMAAGVPTDDTNIMMRAARMTQGRPAAITLTKHLPTASGIGGGSSDAAATLHALAMLDGRALPADLARLGADVAVCVGGVACRMSGIGETLAQIPPLPPLHAVLVNPRVAVATPDVFAAMKNPNNPPMPDPLPAWPDLGTFATFLAAQRNDLEDPAIRIAPTIDGVLASLRATGTPLVVRMSGSGATCFAIYPSVAASTSAANDLQSAHPDWWVRACSLA